MAWQGLKLNLRVSQKQILTPGLVQMVSVLALNRLELREMINQEMIANPVLEELSEEPTQTDNYSDENFLKAETEKVPEKKEANPFDEFDVGSFFNQYLDTGGDGGQSQEAEASRGPSSKSFSPLPRGCLPISTGSSASPSATMPCAKSWKASSGTWMKTVT